MSSLLPQEDIGTDTDKIEEIGKNLTKYIRYLESWVNQFKKIPSRKVMLNKVKNEVWNKMCQSCKSKLYDLKGTDFPSLRDIHTQTSMIPPGLQIDCKGECPTRQANSSDKQSKKGQQSYNIAHPLKDQEDKEDLKELNDILRKTIRTQKVEIKNLELEVEKEKMKAKNTNDGPVTETKKDQTGAHGAAYWRTLNDDLDQENKRLRRELDHTKAELDSGKRERDDCVKKTAQQQISTGGTKSFLRTNEAETSFSEDPDFSFISMSEVPVLTENVSIQPDIATNEGPSCKIGRLEQEVDRLSKELEKAKNDLEKAQGEREEYKNEIFEHQAEKQSLTDTLKRTEEDMSSKTERLQQDVDRLTTELEKTKDELEKLKEETKRHEEEISEREVEKQTLQETLNKTKDEMSSTNTNLQQEVDRLTDALEKNKDDLQEKTKRHEQEISEREVEKQTLQETLNKTIDEMSSTKNLQQEVDRLTDALETNKDELLEKTKRHEQEISEREVEKQTLQETLNKTKDEMSSTNKNLQQEVDRLTDALEEKKNNLTTVQREVEGYRSDIVTLQAEIQDKEKLLNKIKEETSNKLENQQIDIERLKAEIAGKDAEIKILKDALEESQRLRRKVVVMRLLKTSGSGLGKAMVDMVYKELNRRLNGRFDSRKFDFSIVLSETTKDASNGPLFVLCLNMSRIGTNIQDAMEGIKGNRDVYVLVLHHTNKENLSQLTPTSLRVTGSEMRQLGGIIDMAFSSDSGLYDCDLNNNAIEKIVTALKRY